MRVICPLLLSLGLLISLGCETPLAPAPHFGSAAKAARLRMTANPQASEINTEPVLGLAAPTAAGVVENYHYIEEAMRQRQRVQSKTKIETEF